jgi:hypothetical protein
VPEPSVFDFEKTIEKLKRYKSPGIDQIPAELIKVGVRTICSEIHKLINLIQNKEELPEEWKKSIIAPIYKHNKHSVRVVTAEAYQFASYAQNFIQHPTVKANSICRGNYWGSSMWILTQQNNY